MQDHRRDRPPRPTPLERQWSWQASALLIVVSSILGWTIIGLVISKILR
jgi:hypothetical protein